jgi:hypothetical protein
MEDKCSIKGGESYLVYRKQKYLLYTKKYIEFLIFIWVARLVKGKNFRAKAVP